MENSASYHNISEEPPNKIQKRISIFGTHKTNLDEESQEVTEGHVEYYKKLLEEGSKWKEIKSNVKKLRKESNETCSIETLTHDNIQLTEEQIKFLYGDRCDYDKFIHELSKTQRMKRLLALKQKHLENAVQVREELYATHFKQDARMNNYIF